VRPDVDVLVPTAGRVTELAVTLAGLAAQDSPAFSVVISDQSNTGAAAEDPSVRAMLRVLEAQGRPTKYLRHELRAGLAEHRQFLLEQSSAEYVLFLDDDVWLEPGTIERLHTAIRSLGAGFVGASMQGLSYLGDVRPHEQTAFEPWQGTVLPERVRRGSPAFERWRLHNAANISHIAAGSGLAEGEWLAYRIAWVAGCVLFRRQSLVDAGGFDFGAEVPATASGEDVAAQWRVMDTEGGAGIIPSGAVHLESPTTVPVRDVDVFDVIFDHPHSAREP
jgi:GT2 family glycosyltransferase